MNTVRIFHHQTDNALTLRPALSAATERLAKHGIESPRLNAERIFCRILGCTKTDLFLNPDRLLNKTESNRIESFILRRLSGEPLQYILGETEFMSLPFDVTPDVLIPRPETEILVEAVLASLGGMNRLFRILDIGTGSGCIAISLAKYSDALITAVDISESALKTAAGNAAKNGVADRIRFIRADINDLGWMTEPFDIVVSNPPYVTLADWPALPVEVRGFEPRAALCDESDGLTFYHLIASKADRLLKPEGELFFETGDGQGETVKDILAANGLTHLDIKPDYNGIGRVVCGIRKA